MPYNSVISRTDAAALIPEEVSQVMMQNLNASSVALELGTRIPLSQNTTRFPVLSALPVAYFVNGDTGLKQTTEAAWANKYMYVEEIATIVPIPDAVVDDVDFDVWGYLQPLMEGAIARTLDAAVFFGTSKPTAWPDGIVTQAVAAGNVVARGTNAQAAGGIHGDISDLMATLEADGIMPNIAVGNVTFKARLRQVRDTTGQVVVTDPELPPIRYALPGLWPTGASAAELVVGNSANLVVGVRQDMTYKLLDQAVITDNTGAVIFNLAQQDMTAMRLVFRAAWQVSNPINYQQETEGSRFPFAVLRSPA